MVNKKGQIKIQQMSFMLIGLTLFFIVVGLFVLSFVLSGMKNSKSNLNDQQATLLVQKLANSPEFSCGSAFGTQMIDCVDMDKVFALLGHIQNYKGLWRVNGIEIRTIYPNSQTKCTLENYPNCGYMVVLNQTDTGIDKSSYVSLCRKVKSGDSVHNKCELGELIVRTNG